MSVKTAPKRCGRCPACRRVDKAKKWAMPNPPFSHATPETVAGWNEVLAANPCEEEVLCRLGVALTNEEGFDNGLKFGEIVLTRKLTETIVARLTRMTETRAVDPDAEEHWFVVNDRSTRWFLWEGNLPDLIGEDEETVVVLSPDKKIPVKLDQPYASVRMCVSEGAVWWVVRGADPYGAGETKPIEARLFENVLHGRDPWAG